MSNGNRAVSTMRVKSSACHPIGGGSYGESLEQWVAGALALMMSW